MDPNYHRPANADVVEFADVPASDGKLCCGCRDDLAGVAVVVDGWLWHCACYEADCAAADVAAD